MKGRWASLAILQGGKRGSAFSLALAWLMVLSSTAHSGERYHVAKGWAEADNTGGIQSWKGEEPRHEIITIIEDDTLKGEVPLKNDGDFVKMVNQAVAFPHFVAGISKWKIDRVEREKLSNGEKVILIGTYLDSKDRPIRFEEWKYFLNTGYGQVRYSELDGAAPQVHPRSREEVAELLKRYHPFGS